MRAMNPLDRAAGAVIVGGFDGPTLPADVADRLADGRLAGVIYFRRNIIDPAQVRDLCAAVLARAALTPLIALDQEGGRVTRLRDPVIALPPARTLGVIDDVCLTRDLHRALADELAALGVNFDLAPVCDVDSNPANPVVGDRSFGRTPAVVSRHAAAAIEGLHAGAVLACAKHFPGHGDTSTDSHHELPVLAHDRARLEAVELAPFRAAVAAGVDAVMTAHVRFDAIDAGVPATLSYAAMSSLLRADVVSDDLLMRAVSDRWAVEVSAVMAIDAGCDLLLICSDPEAQERARRALAARAHADAAFAERLLAAAARVDGLRARIAPRIVPADALAAFWRRPERVAVLARLDAHRAAATGGVDPTERA
jgi:beta-N-acetylhexosaminidase